MARLSHLHQQFRVLLVRLECAGTSFALGQLVVGLLLRAQSAPVTICSIRLWGYDMRPFLYSCEDLSGCRWGGQLEVEPARHVPHHRLVDIRSTSLTATRRPDHSLRFSVGLAIRVPVEAATIDLAGASTSPPRRRGIRRNPNCSPHDDPSRHAGSGESSGDTRSRTPL